MIIVRNVFIAKPGQATKLAAQFKSAAEAFDAQLKIYATNEALRAALKGYTDLYITGSRELLQTA